MFNNPDIIAKLQYRHNYVQEAGAMNDVFDSQRYKDLCQQNIIINGENTGVRFFSGRYDIATSLLSDGVQIFRAGTGQKPATCWPMMLQNLNLPPEDRAQLRNLIPLAVIPGPSQPKDFNSFLVPFVEECERLARGVETYNVVTGRSFILRHHPLMVNGDMQAIKHFEELKGPNAIIPCRGCLAKGVYHRKKHTYYIPLAEPWDPDNPTTTTTSYDPLRLPLRTEKNLKDQTAEMEAKPDQYEDLGKKYGISGPSILDRIPSIQRPTSYPHEFMHLFLLNHCPDLFSFWAGTFPGIDSPGTGNYLLSRASLAEIGRETEDATYLLPTCFTRPLPNIHTNRGNFCAESWATFFLYVGPVVLRGRLPPKYYDHFMEFSNIIKCLIQLENTTERIEQLRIEIAGYVERFEEYYYQYNYDRLCVCRLTLHALLHVADDVLRCGPAWVSWSFSIERYCREITKCARSKVVPFSTINKNVLQMAQLASVSMRFSEIRKALLFGKSDSPVNVSRMETVYPQYPHSILREPHLPGFPLQINVRRRLAAYFRTNNPGPTFHEWLDFIPERCTRWGKVRIADGGDRIRSASVTNPNSVYGRRDASFVRFTYYKDKNERYRNRPVELVSAIGYGRLDYILALTLPPNPRFNIEEREFHILAHLTEAKDAGGDATVEFVSYTELGRSFILDITAIENVVGRVFTQGVRPVGEWAIVDRSDGLSRTVFHEEEHGYEGDNE